MFLSQTMDEYLENPMGKGSTAIGNRMAIRNDLNNRYEALMKKHNGFEHKQYVLDGVFYFHILVPSESKRNNKYDVVIALEPPAESNRIEKNLKNYEFKVFSNCPSFVYTYAYVYDQYGLLIPFLRPKYKTITLSSEPKVKNPGEVINYDKSVYFACKFITSNPSLMSIMLLIPQCRDLNIMAFSNSIRSTDTIELEIKKEENRLKNEEEKEKNKKLSSREQLRKNAMELEHQINRAKWYNGHVRKKANPLSTRPKITPQAKVKPKPKIKAR